MKSAIQVISFLMILSFSGACFAADDAQLQQERGKVGFAIFRDVCFMMSGNRTRDQRAVYLDSKFPRQDGDKKAAFLKFAPSGQGEVWAAVFPKGVFAVIVETNGNCHVVARQADGATIHTELKSLADQATVNLKGVVVQYHPVADGGAGRSSGFDIKGSDRGPVLTVVLATTFENPPSDKFAAIMTVATSATRK